MLIEGRPTLNPQPFNTKKFILMAGNIGSGKTSLTHLLGETLGCQTAFESVADNPYLADFYADMKTWSFHLQMYFLGHRALQHQKLAESPETAIMDRSIYDDAFIFVRALHSLGNLTDRDYEAYFTLFDSVIANLPKPDLLIHLKAPVEVLLQRIRFRARDIETGIDKPYLELLESLYDEWLSSFDLCPVLTIKSDDLDFVHKPEHLEQVIRHMHESLAGRDELRLF